MDEYEIPQGQDWEEQDGEIEALEVIFPEEINMKQRQPYKFEVTINSNSEEEDNHLKIVLHVELPPSYPQVAPFLRLINKAQTFLDNTTIDKYETEIREMGQENVGAPMIFDICEFLREKISDMNDGVLAKFNKIKDA